MKNNSTSMNEQNELFNKLTAIKYLQISERTLRWYKSEYNKVHLDDPIEPIQKGNIRLYRKSDLDKLRVFAVSRKKTNSSSKTDSDSNTIPKKSIKAKKTSVLNAEELKIDKGFMTLITPLAEQELKQLEESILQNGILNPIIVTKDYVIIDGHNRYAIAKKHNLSIPIKVMNFANRNDTELWIIKNQFSRRNLSKYERGILALKLKPIIAAKAKENQVLGAEITNTGLSKLTEAIDTRSEIAKIAGLSSGTITKIETISNEANEEIIQQILNGKLSINKAYNSIQMSSSKNKMKLSANKQYRNSVFCSFFNDPTKLLSLCNAILDTNYSDVSELEINTLETSMLSNQKNDISCKIHDNFLILIEHQSSVNNNMPFRCLSYVTKLFNNLIDDKNKLYRETLIKFPSPKFFVLYDGDKDEPLRKEMRLSEAFDDDDPALELVVTAFNINYGSEQPILDKCHYLKEYSILVGKVKQGLASGLSLRNSIIRAVNYCIDHDVMKQFLLENQKEVFNMLALQWRINDAKAAWQEEAREEGIQQGIGIGKIQGINIGEMQKSEQIAIKMLRKGKDFGEIQEFTDLPVQRIQELADSIQN